MLIIDIAATTKRMYGRSKQLGAHADKLAGNFGDALALASKFIKLPGVRTMLQFYGNALVAVGKAVEGILRERGKSNLEVWRMASGRPMPGVHYAVELVLDNEWFGAYWARDILKDAYGSNDPKYGLIAAFEDAEAMHRG
jgi:hypothetical protein